MAQEGIPVIVDDIDSSWGSYTLFHWFSINGYWMEIFILDHNMVFRKLTTSTYSIGTEIEQILSEPGWIQGDINNDQSVNILDILIVLNNIIYGENYYFGYDINDDDFIDILDIVFLINIII